MKHSVPHDLGKETAKKAVLAAFASYAERFAKYEPTATWVTDDRATVSFSAKGMTLKGAIEVRPTSVDLDVDIPFLLRPFKDRAIAPIEREIGKWIDKAKRGEL